MAAPSPLSEAEVIEELRAFFGNGFTVPREALGEKMKGVISSFTLTMPTAEALGSVTPILGGVNVSVQAKVTFTSRNGEGMRPIEATLLHDLRKVPIGKAVASAGALIQARSHGAQGEGDTVTAHVKCVVTIFDHHFRWQKWSRERDAAKAA